MSLLDEIESLHEKKELYLFIYFSVKKIKHIEKIKNNQGVIL
jgi:hypothetical protein